MAKIPGGKPVVKVEPLLAGDSGVVNEHGSMFTKDRPLPIPEDPANAALFDEKGNLTEVGERVAVENGWKVQARNAPGGGMTGHLKE